MDTLKQGALVRSKKSGFYGMLVAGVKLNDGGVLWFKGTKNPKLHLEIGPSDESFDPLEKFPFLHIWSLSEKDSAVETASHLNRYEAGSPYVVSDAQLFTANNIFFVIELPGGNKQLVSVTGILVDPSTPLSGKRIRRIDSWSIEVGTKLGAGLITDYEP